MTTSSHPGAPAFFDPTLLALGEEVSEALAHGRPVVALESSVLSGFPYPDNLALAREMDAGIRAQGAVPARIALLGGKLRVGLDDDLLQEFCAYGKVPKVSTRDIGITLAAGGPGGTTVSSSLLAAELAGIRVFAVAGIGGVHRDAPASFDISTDLVQFTRARTAVVCAGAKSMLHPQWTLEWLETAGIPVIGYRCDDFPAYLSVSSGVRNPHRLDDLAEIARATWAHWRSGNDTSVLVTHPIAEADGIPSQEIADALAEATERAGREGITGPAVTPYLLKAIAEATEGRTADANVSVLKSTTALAAEFAVHVAKEEQR
ncbi:pseudouridine-5'-phosphate glycosidase [Streptomyces sp. NPDC094032]|uniref:pseudouridine-5'-phosphate glycosidase n=1 Tax=Streptomyces sp. NPDC094032 TaxID=3155308 RepID=UPI003322F57E